MKRVLGVFLGIFLLVGIGVTAESQYRNSHKVTLLTSGGSVAWTNVNTSLTRWFPDLQTIAIAFDSGIVNTSTVYYKPSATAKKINLMETGSGDFQSAIWSSDGTGYPIIPGGVIEISNTATNVAEVTIQYLQGE